MNKIKVRILGSYKGCERILSHLPKPKTIRKFDRSKERAKNPYNRIFGKAEVVFYLEFPEAK